MKAKTSTAHPVSDNQKALAQALAFQIAGRGQFPAHQRRVETQILSVLQSFGGSIVAYDATSRPFTFPASRVCETEE